MIQRLAAPLVGGAALSYAATCVLGAGTASGVFRTENSRWVHHAFFIVTSTLTGAAACASMAKRPSIALTLVPASAALIALASRRVRAGSADHSRIALSAAPSYAAAVIESLRS
ncbi:hypothetical protein FB385_0444 [Paramicrobacterium agarici]|nr:hypothetical protein FB385_0444 [Microbacterium agarici]